MKDFREKLSNVILQGFEQAKENQRDEVKEQAERYVSEIQKQELPFR